MEFGVNSDPYLAIVAELVAERSRLDGLLDDALAQFALFEDGFSQRLASANAAQRQALMEERAQLEDVLGIADLVDRIDRIRERIAMLETQVASAAA